MILLAALLADSERLCSAPGIEDEDAHTVATQLPLEMDREVVQDASIASTLRLYGTKVLKREGPW